MKIRWRQHECIMVTAAAVSLAAGFFFAIAREGVAAYENEFSSHHAAFDLYRNLILASEQRLPQGTLRYI